MTNSFGHAFDLDDTFLLETVLEEPEIDDVTKADVEAATSKTATLVAAAEKEMQELGELLARLKTGTATRREVDRIQSLNDKLSVLKRKVETSKLESKTKELGYLKTETARKTFSLKKAVKEREVKSVIRAVCASSSYSHCLEDRAPDTFGNTSRHSFYVT